MKCRNTCTQISMYIHSPTSLILTSTSSIYCSVLYELLLGGTSFTNYQPSMSLILEKCQNCYFMIDSSKYSMYSFVAHIKKACIEKVRSTGCNLTRDAYVAVKIYIILTKNMTYQHYTPIYVYYILGHEHQFQC